MRDAWKPVIAAWIMSKSVMYNVSAFFYDYYINKCSKMTITINEENYLTNTEFLKMSLISEMAQVEFS